MIREVLFLLQLLGPAPETPAAEAALLAPPARTAKSVAAELEGERKALCSAQKDLGRAAHEARRPAAGKAPSEEAGRTAPDLDALRHGIALRRVRCSELRAELQEIRSSDRALARADLPAEKLAEARERIPALRAEVEAARLELVEGRGVLARAASQDDLARAEASLTRSEEKLAATRARLDKALAGYLPLP